MTLLSRFRLLMLYACALIAAAAATPLTAAEQLDRIVAVVNDDVVLASELAAEVRQVTNQARARGASLPPPAILERQVLERLIMVRLQLSLAQRAGIHVDETTLNAAVRRIADQNNLSLSQFRDALEADGVNFADFREAVREEITIMRLRQRQIESQIHVSAQEIDEMLATAGGADAPEYLVGHILIPVPEGATAEQIQSARARAEAVLAELRAGADFAVAAATHSAGQTALQGGSLGWRTEAELPTLFAGIVPSMAVGQISEVIDSPSGFHIIQLQERRRGEPQMVTQTRARHILIRSDALISEEEARLRAETLRQRIAAGADFAELARAHSADRGSAARGGDLAWFNPGTMVPEFERAMNQLAIGEISEPVRTAYGWHIIEVLDRRQRDVGEETLRINAAERIRARKVEEATESWLRRLRDEAYVEVRLES